LILSDEKNYKTILFDRQLADTLFVRLYFLDGKGLKHFKLFREEKDQEQYIKVFEIIWD